MGAQHGNPGIAQMLLPQVFWALFPGNSLFSDPFCSCGRAEGSGGFLPCPAAIQRAQPVPGVLCQEIQAVPWNPGCATGSRLIQAIRCPAGQAGAPKPVPGAGASHGHSSILTGSSLPCLFPFPSIPNAQPWEKGCAGNLEAPWEAVPAHHLLQSLLSRGGFKGSEEFKGSELFFPKRRG